MKNKKQYLKEMGVEIWQDKNKAKKAKIKAQTKLNVLSK